MVTYDEAIAFLEEHGVYCDPSSYPEDEPWLNEVGEYVCDELEGMAEYDEDDGDVYDEDDLLSLVNGAKAYEEDAKQRYEADMEALGEDENEDDIINESVEPFPNEEEESTKSTDKDTDHIDAGSFAAMLDDVGDAGEHFDPSDDEYQAHQEVIDKIFNPNNIEELGWSVVPTTDDDGRDYMTVTHFLKEADWNKLYDLYSDYQSSESLKKKLKKKFGDYRFEIFFFLDWGTPIFDYPAISFFRAKD